MYYLIENTLRECTAEECRSGKSQYVAILTPEEWKNERDDFEMGIDMDLNADEIHATKAEVNYDSVTGTFALPDRQDMSAEYRKFAFALDEKGIVFIDPEDTVSQIIGSIVRVKKWRFPSLERFIYDFLEQIIQDDLRLLERYETELDAVDQDIDNDAHADLQKVNNVRGNLRILRVHYDHLIDMAQEFEENENSFF
nr:magnesium transporter CorA [Lachnospiraceae bacterium]